MQDIHLEEEKVTQTKIKKVTGGAADARAAGLNEEMTQYTITKDYADVLLIVTGGTLCMVHSD
jgi:hypothetical protein